MFSDALHHSFLRAIYHPSEPIHSECPSASLPSLSGRSQVLMRFHMAILCTETVAYMYLL